MTWELEQVWLLVVAVQRSWPTTRDHVCIARRLGRCARCRRKPIGHWLCRSHPVHRHDSRSLGCANDRYRELAVTTDGGESTSYTVGETVMLYGEATLINWMLGTVTAWNWRRDMLTVDVTLTSGSGTLANPRVGKGDARLRDYYVYTGSPNSTGRTTAAASSRARFYTECRTSIGSTPGSPFSRRIVTATSGPVSLPR